MKRILSLFLSLALLAALAGCQKAEEPPSVPIAPVSPESGGITLSELNIEFTTGSRDADTLMALKQELPALLISALAEQEVSVQKVNITFGASDDATAQALSMGTVQIGFLPTEVYLAHADALVVTDVSLSPEIIAFGATRSEYALALREKDGAWSWEDLAQAVWALPHDESSFALRWLNAYLDKHYDGKTAADLPNALRYGADGAMDGEVFDLYVANNSEPFAAEYVSDALALPYFFSGVAVVSAADDILNSDEFLSALSVAIGSLSADEEGALYAYNSTRYGYLEQGTHEKTFEVWQLVYDFEHR